MSWRGDEVKPRIVNGRWELILPDHIADWDALDDWERCRFDDMEKRLEPGMRLYDVGTEHGELSAIYSTFVGGGNMVLIEPTCQFWPNIRLIWEANGIQRPRACVRALLGEETRAGDDQSVFTRSWPDCAEGDEQPARAYSYLHDPTTNQGVARWRLDGLSSMCGVPSAITIDVEGAELGVLKGAHRILDMARPIVWVSIHPDMMERDYNVKEGNLHHYMKDMGYEGSHLGVDHEIHWRFDPR